MLALADVPSTAESGSASGTTSGLGDSCCRRSELPSPSRRRRKDAQPGRRAGRSCQPSSPRRSGTPAHTAAAKSPAAIAADASGLIRISPIPCCPYEKSIRSVEVVYRAYPTLRRLSVSLLRGSFTSTQWGGPPRPPIFTSGVGLPARLIRPWPAHSSPCQPSSARGRSACRL